MSSRVTAVRSSQPRIGVGTSDNMIDLLLRTPYTYPKMRRGQRGSGVSDILQDFTRGARRGVTQGWKTKSLAVAKRGVKRAAANAIYNELDRQATKQLQGLTGVQGKVAKLVYPKIKRQAKKKLDDVFGVSGFIPEETKIPHWGLLGSLPEGSPQRLAAEAILRG